MNDLELKNDLPDNDTSLHNETGADTEQQNQSNNGSKHISGSLEHVIADKLRARADKTDDPVLKEVLKDLSLVLDLSKSDFIDTIKVIDKELDYRFDGYSEAKANMLEKIPDNIKEPIAKILSGIDKLNSYSKMDLITIVTKISDAVKEQKEDLVEMEKQDTEKNSVDINEAELIETAPVDLDENNDDAANEKLQDKISELDKDDKTEQKIIDENLTDKIDIPTDNNIEVQALDINDDVSAPETDEIDTKEFLSADENKIEIDDVAEEDVDDKQETDETAEIDIDENVTADRTTLSSKSDTIEDVESDESKNKDFYEPDVFDKYEKPERLDDPENEFDRKNTEENADITDEALEYDRMDDAPVEFTPEQIEDTDAGEETETSKDNIPAELDSIDDVTDLPDSIEMTASDIDGDGTVNDSDNNDVVESVSEEIPESIIDTDKEEYADDTANDSLEGLTEPQNESDVTDNAAVFADDDTIDRVEDNQTETEEMISSDDDVNDLTTDTAADSINEVENVGNSLDDLSYEWNDDSSDNEFYKDVVEAEQSFDSAADTYTSAENEIENLNDTDNGSISDMIDNAANNGITDDQMDFEMPEQTFDEVGIDEVDIVDTYDDIQNISDIIDFASEFSDDAILPEADDVDMGIEYENNDFEISNEEFDTDIGDFGGIDEEEIAELLIL